MQKTTRAVSAARIASAERSRFQIAVEKNIRSGRNLRKREIRNAPPRIMTIPKETVRIGTGAPPAPAPGLTTA